MLKSLSCEIILEFLGGSNVVTKVLIRGRQQGQSKADVTMEVEKERLDHATLTAGFEDGEAWWAAVCGVTQSQTRLK